MKLLEFPNLLLSNSGNSFRSFSVLLLSRFSSFLVMPCREFFNLLYLDSRDLSFPYSWPLRCQLLCCPFIMTHSFLVHYEESFIPWSESVACTHPEDKFLDVIETKSLFRVFLLAIHSLKHRVQRVVTAAFWRTFHLEGKISPGWWGWGVHVHPLSLHLPSPVKLQCSLQLSGQTH